MAVWPINFKSPFAKDLPPVLSQTSNLFLLTTPLLPWHQPTRSPRTDNIKLILPYPFLRQRCLEPHLLHQSQNLISHDITILRIIPDLVPPIYGKIAAILSSVSFPCLAFNFTTCPSVKQLVIPCRIPYSDPSAYPKLWLNPSPPFIFWPRNPKLAYAARNKPVITSNCASDCGLSSTGHPIQPKDTFLMRPFSPYRYLT